MMDMTKVDGIIDRHGGRKQDVIAMLLECQEEFRYVPREIVERVARRVGVPVTVVMGIATFYRGFSLKPVGKYQISVCTGTACHVLGARKLVEAFERELKVKCGDTAPDGLFSLHTINCPGCCGLAPVVTVNQDVHGKIAQSRIRRLVERYRKAPDRKEVSVAPSHH
jgi:NADH:ubiquinone oxidoreductase subunit E